jgi:hypothetical protein
LPHLTKPSDTPNTQVSHLTPLLRVPR